MTDSYYELDVGTGTNFIGQNIHKTETHTDRSIIQCCSVDIPHSIAVGYIKLHEKLQVREQLHIHEKLQLQ